MNLIGLDEAGRGPVFGSLFIAGVRIPENHPILQTAKESKSTTTNQIFETAQEAVQDEEIQIVVKEVTAESLTETENITTLTADWMVEIATMLTEGDIVCADSCVKDEDRFENAFPDEEFTSVRAEHKADENYPIVSVAGCIAKYCRELHIEQLNELFEADIGSGYPSDTTTREFLREFYSQHTEFPAETRLSWSTCETLREEAEQSTVGEF